MNEVNSVATVNVYKELVSVSMLRKFEKMREHYLNITNAFYGKVIEKQKEYTKNFQNKLNDSVKDHTITATTNGGGWVTVYKRGIKTYEVEIASINLIDNRIHFRRKGAGIVTKVIKFQKELTPEKAYKYIVRFGTL